MEKGKKGRKSNSNPHTGKGVERNAKTKHFYAKRRQKGKRKMRTNQGNRKQHTKTLNLYHQAHPETNLDTNKKT